MRSIITDLEVLLEKYQSIGLLVSGGLDSTLLAYLLHDIVSKKNLTNTFQFFVVPRPDDSVLHVNRVVDYISKHFNIRPIIHVVCTGDLHHSKQVTSGIREALENYDCDIFLSSITTNPPEKLPNYAYGTFLEPDGTSYDGPIRIKSWHSKLLDPFWDYTKEDTVKIIKDYNLIDIMNLTHTCTGSKSIRCNRCWQCCERSWAFNKNNFIDTGTM